MVATQEGSRRDQQGEKWRGEDGKERTERIGREGQEGKDKTGRIGRGGIEARFGGYIFVKSSIFDSCWSEEKFCFKGSSYLRNFPKGEECFSQGLRLYFWAQVSDEYVVVLCKKFYQQLDTNTRTVCNKYDFLSLTNTSSLWKNIVASQRHSMDALVTRYCILSNSRE